MVKHDEPKSMTLISQREYDLIRMFSGLRSQWMRSRLCTKRSASRHCLAMRRSRGSVKYGSQPASRLYRENS